MVSEYHSVDKPTCLAHYAMDLFPQDPWISLIVRMRDIKAVKQCYRWFCHSVNGHLLKSCRDIIIQSPPARGAVDMNDDASTPYRAIAIHCHAHDVPPFGKLRW